MSFKRKTLLTLLSMAMATHAFAAESEDAGAQLVKKLANGRVAVVKSFPSVGNLEGFVVETLNGPKQQSIVYADKDGKYMIPGEVVSAEGINLVDADYKKYISTVQDPKIYANATQAHWVEEGKSNAQHKVYILAEPNCSACNMLYKELKPKVESGQLAIRWIFVAFMKPESAGMVAAIMQAKNPGQIVALNESKFDLKTETGGAKPTTINPKTQDAIKQNMNFMMQSGFAGTPGIIFKTKDGKVQVARGFVKGKALDDMIETMSSSFE
jgi:thiol:disulfide interchange protein DsbG